MSKNEVVRLYQNFQPTHYELELTVDPDKHKFSGTVIVTGRKVGPPSQRLTFHQKGLKITESQIKKHSKKEDENFTVDRINHHNKFDEVRLHSKKKLYAGLYTVTLKFSGKITRQMNGLYPCFFEQDGQKKKIMATQFESHHAREVFPCVDEPEAKATFKLTLNTPCADTVLSNTQVIEESKADENLPKNYKKTVFDTTPRMSTYLLAFVHGDLGHKEAKTKDGVVIRTYATPDNVKFTDFALDVAVKVLEFYNEYFDIPYPLQKCDMVALPDFASGAMENWGLITYREQVFLNDPENTSLHTKQYIAMVVAHELAHQWFGNLVTMRWWTDLWLNEGFASWIEYLALAELFPEWEMWTQFIPDEQHRAFKLDALEHTHPIEVPVRHPDEIRTIFDGISYSKGASVIHMLHEYLTPEKFRDGLRLYLKKHAYGNTDTVDLWSALEESSNKPVKSFMGAWTSKPGFPLVTARVSGNTATVIQERFFINPETTASKLETWPLPTLSDAYNAPSLIKEEREIFSFESDQVFKLNRGQSGFYITTYNSEHLLELKKSVQASKMPALDRLGLLSDLFETTKVGKTQLTDTMNFLEAFKDEANSAVWDIIGGGLAGLRGVLDDEELRELMKPYVIELTAKQLKRLGWESKKNESHFDQLLRPTIIGLAASADEPSVIKEALRQYDQMKKPEDIKPDLRGIVFRTAVRKHNDTKTFNRLFEMHEATSMSEIRTVIAASLTGFKDTKLNKKALDLINSDSVRLQDVGHWLVYAFSNRHNKAYAWEWMKKEWDWLEKYLGTDLSFSRSPMYAASAFSDREFLEEYKNFFFPKKNPVLSRSINQGVEVITWHAAWKERDLETAQQFFKNYEL